MRSLKFNLIYFYRSHIVRVPTRSKTEISDYKCRCSVLCFIGNLHVDLEAKLNGRTLKQVTSFSYLHFMHLAQMISKIGIRIL